MKMTRERKIYAWILALAAGALMIDQVILGGGSTGPEEASAMTPAAEMDAEAGPAAPPEAATASTLAQATAVLKRVSRAAVALDEEDSIARRLAALAEQRGVEASSCADAFRPAESWIAPPRSVEGEDRASPGPDAAEAFIAGHDLLAILTTGDGGMVILAGRRKPMTVGQALDGFTLVSVTRRAAVFESGEARATLELQRPYIWD